MEGREQLCGVASRPCLNGFKESILGFQACAVSIAYPLSHLADPKTEEFTGFWIEQTDLVGVSEVCSNALCTGFASFSLRKKMAFHWLLLIDYYKNEFPSHHSKHCVLRNLRTLASLKNEGIGGDELWSILEPHFRDPPNWVKCDIS